MITQRGLRSRFFEGGGWRARHTRSSEYESIVVALSFHPALPSKGVLSMRSSCCRGFLSCHRLHSHTALLASENLGALMLRPRTSRMGGLNEPQGREGREGGTSSDLLSFDSSSAHMGVWLRARVVFVHHVVPRVNVRARQAPPPPLTQQINQENTESHTHTTIHTHKNTPQRPNRTAASATRLRV